MVRNSAAAVKALEATAKKARLTTAQLAAYDDVLTDVLVDHVFAWHETRKTLGPWQVRNFKHRGITGEDVTKILFEDVVLAKSPETALKNLIKLPGLKRYIATLDTGREKQDFINHMQRYINIWLPECAFEISFTNRYMIDQWEAKTTARRYIKAGEKIKYLAGNLVSIPIDEEEDEQFISNAFSITYSSRKKTKSLFLGPARFSNHDCDANAKLESRGSEGMVVIAVRDIGEGDEINVHYGDNYFGEDNCECLCVSCEKKVIGGWQHRPAGDAGGLSTPRAGSESDNEDPGSRRSKRKRQRIDYSQKIRNARGQDNKEEESAPKRRKVSDDEFLGLLTPKGYGKSSKAKPKSPAKASPKPMRKGTKILDPRDASIWAQIGTKNPVHRRTPLPAQFGRARLLSIESDGERSSTASVQPTHHFGTSSPKPARKAGKTISHNSHMLFAFLKGEVFDSDEDSKLEDIPTATDLVPSIELEDPKSLGSSNSGDETSLFDRAERQSGSPLTEPSCSVSRAVDSEINTTEADDIVDEKRDQQGRSQLGISNILSVPDDVATPESEAVENQMAFSQEVAAAAESTSSFLDTSLEFDNQESNEMGSALPDASLNNEMDDEHQDSDNDSDTESESEPRYPGDYIRTERLLGPKNSRWVECRTCDTLFVQQDGHQTRRECPRCERHSKLYGFQWPQMEHERGGPDRVMDHRTVNRFLSHAEESAEPKKRIRRGG